jgi:hypothetical protein
MKFLIVLLFILNFKLFSQVGYPDYSAEIFGKDTVNLVMYSVDLTFKKKAELYAYAETWAIQKSLYGSNSDTIGKNRSENAQKESCKIFKNQFLNSDPYLEKVVFYFMDLNQDNKLDIIKTYSDFSYRVGNRDSINKLKLYYPSASDNNVTFFISTKDKFYNKYFLPGRLNSLGKLNNEFCFTCISYSCCDESVTRIDKFSLSAKTSEFKREYTIWADYNPFYDHNINCFPKEFGKPKPYLLNEAIVQYTGVYHCTEGGRMSLPFEKNSVIRVLSEEGDDYFVEFEVKKNTNECTILDNLYFLSCWKKADFQKIVRKAD